MPEAEAVRLELRRLKPAFKAPFTGAVPAARREPEACKAQRLSAGDDRKFGRWQGKQSFMT
jgi:hypothetical protein